MKRKLTYLLLAMMSVLLCYGGAGVNLVSYCCTDCETEGVTALISDKCCEIHDHYDNSTSNHSHLGVTDSCGHAQEDSCSLERIEFEWQSFPAPVFSFCPMMCYLPISLALYLCPILSDVTEDNNQLDDSPPPVPLPKLYLSLLTTLLI